MERIFKDQMNRTIRLEEIPCRIVSLVPSQTELLYELGLGDKVVGITKFCIYPDEWFQTKKRVGGTKQLSIEAIKKLNPDLIIGNKEENTKEAIEELEKIAPVWLSDIYTIQDALNMIEQIGQLTDTFLKSTEIIKEIRSAFASLLKSNNTKKVLYFIWNDPFYVVGKNTFISDMIKACGWINVCKEERYPEWVFTELQPDYVFLSSEPYPFNSSHISEMEKRFPKSKVILVDGELFSWYGSRMKFSPAYFQQLIHQLTN